VVVPLATGVIAPVEALMVATAVLLDVQVPPVLPLVVKVTPEPPWQIPCVPLKVPALLATVTDLVADALLQPPVPMIVYVIVEEPGATGVMAPVEALMVATAVLKDDHVPPAFPLDVKVTVPSKHKF
jgi:hypothetical protein